jgi:asparagine synthase (glutamine-hydrolysing)
MSYPDELNRLSVMDLKHYFEGDLMVKNDRMLMAHGVEARLPFMDRLLFEFVARVPVDLRLRGLERRWLQKQAMKAHVPTATRRRANMGLEMPHSAWFPGPLRHLAEHWLAPERVARTGFLEPREVTRLWNDHLARRRDNGRALWSLITLLAWFELFVASSDYRAHLA